MTRVALGAVLCAACGNYSTEDLEFLAALPQREDLRAEVPAGGTSGAATVCALGTADVWLQSKPASDEWNVGVERVIGLVDVVRRYPPTWRKDDQRRWGPFADEKHPGVEIQVVIARDFPAALGGQPRYVYAFQARRTGDFTSVIAGTFEGPSSLRGKGAVGLDFEAFWTLGMNDADTPHGAALIEYDRSGDPATIYFGMRQEGFPAPQFVYGFRGWRDASGRFGYRFLDANANVFAVLASYGAAGAGRDVVTVTTPVGFTGQVRQCWDAAACLVFVDDPLNLTCPSPPCTRGSELDCPPVPEDPLDPWPPIELAP